MESTASGAMIRLFGVSKRYPGRSALDAVTLDIQENEFVFVTGPSGAGKTTLLRLLYQGELASEGQILLDGMNLARIGRRRIAFLRRKLGIIFQDYKLIATQTVFENVALVLAAAGVKQRRIAKQVKGVLQTVGMADRMDALPPSLSGGEQQRVAVARAVVGEPKIILADEPTGSLDAESARVIMELLGRFHRRGGTVLLATHDLELIESTPGRVIQLKGGKIVSDTNAQSGMRD